MPPERSPVSYPIDPKAACQVGIPLHPGAERYFRDAPLMIVGEGTNEIQRNVIAAQLMARLAEGDSLAGFHL